MAVSSGTYHWKQYLIGREMSAADIPKDKIRDCIRALKDVELPAPVQVGDVVLENVCGTGINVVATKTIERV